MPRIKLKQIFKIIISCLIIIYLLTLVKIPLLRRAVSHGRLLFIGLALLMIALNTLISSYRWLLIINKDGKHLSYLDALSMCLTGDSLNIFMPASSGDIAKAYYGYQWFGLKEEILSTNFVDKLAGAFSLFMIATFSALILRFYALGAFFSMIALLLALLFLFTRLVPWNLLNRFLLRYVKSGFDVQKMQEASKVDGRLKVLLVTISVLAWVFGFTELYFIYNVFTNKVSFPFVLIIGPITNLAYLFPFTLNGLGSSDAVIVAGLHYLQITATIGVLTAFLHRLISVVPGLIGWALILAKKRGRQ